jgi:hypothetical protein
LRGKVKKFLKKVEVEAKVEEEAPPGKITKYKLQITNKAAPFEQITVSRVSKVSGYGHWGRVRRRNSHQDTRFKK